MKELGLNLAEVATFFVEEADTPYVLVKVNGDRAAEWSDLMRVPARRCYIADGRLRRIIEEQGHSADTVVRAVLPPTGSTMAGDYGEIITAMYLAAEAAPTKC